MKRIVLPARIAFWALAGFALLVSHDAIFLGQLGPGEALAQALRSAGHGYWGLARLALVATAATAGFASVVRLAILRYRARQLGARTGAGYAPRPGRLIATWVRLFAVVALAFVIQESLEHLGMHGHAIGLGALIGPEYPLALPVIGLITLLGALVATAVTRTECHLLATIATAIRGAMRRAPRSLVRPPLRLLHPATSPLARATAGRAPPRMLVPAT